VTTTPITGEVWGQDIDGPRAYMLREAEQPLAALAAKMATAHAGFIAALGGVSDAQARFAPASGEGEDAWGIAEVVRHVASIEPIMAERVRLLGMGEPVESLRRTHPGYLEDVETRELSKLRAALDESHAAMLAALAAIDGHERLDTLAPHRRFGELNCHGWVVLHTVHLQDHARQIDKIKRMPGYPQA
jgi:DinB family protein